MATSENKVVQSCEKHWESHKADCSGFVRAVAAELGVTLVGNADDIVNGLGTAAWTKLRDGSEAKQKAELGWLVIGALKGSDHTPARTHGHVVVVIAGPLAQGKYPSAYWGSLGSAGKKNATVNWSWAKADRDKVTYVGRVL